MNKEIQTIPYRIDRRSKPKREDYGYEGGSTNAWMLVGGEEEYNEDCKEWEQQEARDACGDKD